MPQIKLCGIKRECEIEWVNQLEPEYIGFVFAPKSKRYVTLKEAKKLKAMLHHSIKAVGVFVDEEPDRIVELVEQGIIDVVQLHGREEQAYLERLREKISVPIFQAFCIRDKRDILRAEKSSADMILLDAGTGCGACFDWRLLKDMKRNYFLAGGLTAENVTNAIKSLHPYGVDASSSLEINGQKVKEKMQAFVEACVE